MVLVSATGFYYIKVSTLKALQTFYKRSHEPSASISSVGDRRAASDSGEGGWSDHGQEEAVWLAGSGAHQICTHD